MFEKCYSLPEPPPLPPNSGGRTAQNPPDSRRASFTAPGATSAQPPVNAQIFTFNPTTTQFITLQALNTFASNGLNDAPGIGEVAFREVRDVQDVPEPSTMLGAGMAVGFGAFLKKRKKSKPDSDKA